MAKRPAQYFRPKNWPAQLTIDITLPPALEAQMKPDEIRRRVQDVVRRREAEALTESKKSGRSYLGARRAQG